MRRKCEGSTFDTTTPDGFLCSPGPEVFVYDGLAFLLMLFQPKAGNSGHGVEINGGGVKSSMLQAPKLKFACQIW